MATSYAVLHHPSRLAATLLLLSGCSVFLMKRVPSDHPSDEYPNCSSATTMPLGDAALTVLSGATAVNLHSAASNPDNDGSFRTLAWSTTGLALVFLGSATYGAVQRNRCIRAKLRSGVDINDTPGLDRALPGTIGGSCRRDGGCDGDLICDAPMKTCIPIDPTDKKDLPPTGP